MESDPDHQLMRRIAENDVLAYRELVGKYLNFCVRFAERMLGNRQDAEDVAQECCLKIWQAAESWHPQSKFSTWLYRVVLNKCIDHKRKVVHFAYVEMDEMADPAPGADDRVIQMEAAKSVRQALHTLPHRQRAALILTYYEGLSNKQAAEAMDTHVGALEGLLFRARQSLKDSLIREEKAANGQKT